MARDKDSYGYTTVRIPFYSNPSNRDSSLPKDGALFNCMPEAEKNELTERKSYYVFKRDGLTLRSSPDTTNEARGVFFWEKTGKVYSVFGNKLYSNTTSIQTLTTSTSPVGFVVTTGVSERLMLVDGTKGYLITTLDAVSEITDVDFPTPHSPTPVYLDGYVFLLKSGTAEIYNSNLDDPTSWQASNFLTSELYPDTGVALARQLNYIVCFNTTSTELFFDAANAAGSPLQRNEQAAIKLGAASAHTVFQNERFITWVAQSETGGPSVWTLEGFQPKKISDESIERILKAEASLSALRAFGVRVKGHLLYVLNCPTANISLVYDFEEKLWHFWSSNSGGNHVKFAYSFATDAQGVYVVQGDADGSLYNMSPTVYQDHGTNIIVQIVTEKYDGGTNRSKFHYRLEIVSDVISGATMSVRYTDDDYNTYSTSRSLDLSKRPFTRTLGSFRRRAFEFTHTSNTPLRIWGMEIDVNLGVN